MKINLVNMYLLPYWLTLYGGLFGLSLYFDVGFGNIAIMPNCNKLLIEKWLWIKLKLTVSNSSWRCMWVLMKRILWIVFSITNGSFFCTLSSSEPEISFWNPLKIESKWLFNCPLSLSGGQPLNPLIQLPFIGGTSSVNSAKVGSAWRKYLLFLRPWLAFTTWD